MQRARLAAALLLAPMALLAPAAEAIDCSGTSTGLIPLTDLGSAPYHGFEGGLYPGGSNVRPQAHTDLGLALARLIVPRDVAGVPDPVLGRIVFLSIGMSNTRNEFTAFVPVSDADPLRDANVKAFNGAIGGQDSATIADPAAPYWSQVDQMLLTAGLSPLQVQAVWLKEAKAGPTGGFPAAAQALERDLRAIVQNIAAYFPNVKLVYLASRIYAGYATTTLNPEAYAYESGFSVKWLIGDQLAQPLPFVSLTDLTRGAVMPWLSWGPYLWADGLVPRGDGLTWSCTDFNADGTHPNPQGSAKVAHLLLDFVHTDPTARAWYVDGGGLPSLS